MEGCLQVTLPQSGFVQQAVKQEQKAVGFYFFVAYFNRLQFAHYCGRYMLVMHHSR